MWDCGGEGLECLLEGPFGVIILNSVPLAGARSLLFGRPFWRFEWGFQIEGCGFGVLGRWFRQRVGTIESNVVYGIERVQKGGSTEQWKFTGHHISS